jgi:glutamate dehydrogenase (NAD(P)+)
MTVLLPHHDAQLVCSAVDGSEVIGYVVIDSTIGGRSVGGLRMMPDVGEAELREVARTMTLKYGFLGIAVGGAKGGVRGDPEAPQEERRLGLAAFARAVAPLLRTGVWSPGPDMGTDNDDILHLMQTVGMAANRGQWERGRTGYYTALTVLSGVRQALGHIGLSLPQCTVAIEGWGKVGSAVGQLLAEEGARIVAVSTARGAICNAQGLDVRKLQSLAAETGSCAVEVYEGAQHLERAALLSLPVDVLCPCARHHSVHAGNAESVAARVICPGANNPLTAEAERLLFQRGVLCLPDFVTNCGGALGGTLESAGASSAQISAFIEQHIDRRIAWLLDEAARQQALPRDVAVPLALRRFEEMRRYASRATVSAVFGQFQRLAQKLQARGWVPKRLSAAVMTAYLARSMAW